MPPNDQIRADNPSDREEALKQIRINIAFEQLILSVLSGAALGGVLMLALGLGGLTLSGALSAPNILSILIKALTASFLIFLTGFFASIAVMTPLFWAMEKARRRNVWPYVAASVCVAFIVFMLATGETPFTTKNIGEAFSVSIIPAVVIALIFGRRMQPFWKAAAQTDAAERNHVPTLH